LNKAIKNNLIFIPLLLLPIIGIWFCKAKILHKMKIDNHRITPITRDELILFPELETKGKIDY